MRARPTPSYRRYKLSPRNPENRANEGREWLNTDYSRRGLTYKLGAVADPFLMAVSPAYRATAGPQTAIDLRFPPGAAAARARNGFLESHRENIGGGRVLSRRA